MGVLPVNNNPAIASTVDVCFTAYNRNEKEMTCAE